MLYRIVFSTETKDHFRFLTARQQATLLAAVERHLRLEPSAETKNRKLMRPNSLASWELRVGNLRVYYDVEVQPEGVVRIRAVGVKERNQVRVGGKVIEL